LNACPSTLSNWPIFDCLSSLSRAGDQPMRDNGHRVVMIYDSERIDGTCPLFVLSCVELCCQIFIAHQRPLLVGNKNMTRHSTHLPGTTHLFEGV